MDPVVYFELPAKDMERAMAFYEEVFGWKIDCTYETYYQLKTAEGMESGALSDIPGVINGAVQKKDETIGSIRLVIKVADLDKTLEKALLKGAKIFIPKKRLPHMYYLVIYDTEGNEVNIIGPLE
jgi:uncharacterized protein